MEWYRGPLSIVFRWSQWDVDTRLLATLHHLGIILWTSLIWENYFGKMYNGKILFLSPFLLRGLLQFRLWPFRLLPPTQSQPSSQVRKCRAISKAHVFIIIAVTAVCNVEVTICSYRQTCTWNKESYLCCQVYCLFLFFTAKQQMACLLSCREKNILLHVTLVPRSVT